MSETLCIGIVVSLLVTELTGFSPGGIIVAGYLAMFFFQPVWLLGTLAAALITYGIMKLLEERLLLYGRRQFAISLLLGVLISQLLMRLAAGYGQGDWVLLVVGYLVPGLMARDFSRQGVGATLLVTALAVVLTRAAVLTGDGLLW